MDVILDQYFDRQVALLENLPFTPGVLRVNFLRNSCVADARDRFLQTVVEESKGNELDRVLVAKADGDIANDDALESLQNLLPISIE